LLFEDTTDHNNDIFNTKKVNPITAIISSLRGVICQAKQNKSKQNKQMNNNSKMLHSIM
jgi:hypothetical protein